MQSFELGRFGDSQCHLISRTSDGRGLFRDLPVALGYFARPHGHILQKCVVEIGHRRAEPKELKQQTFSRYLIFLLQGVLRRRQCRPESWTWRRVWRRSGRGRRWCRRRRTQSWARVSWRTSRWGGTGRTQGGCRWTRRRSSISSRTSWRGPRHICSTRCWWNPADWGPTSGNVRGWVERLRQKSLRTYQLGYFEGARPRPDVRRVVAQVCLDLGVGRDRRCCGMLRRKPLIGHLVLKKNQ